jgi:dienelactone hydrolase
LAHDTTTSTLDVVVIGPDGPGSARHSTWGDPRTMAQVAIPVRRYAWPRWSSVIRQIGAVIGGALDGLLVGLTIGYVLLTAVGAPANAVGLPDGIAVVLVGMCVGGVALLGAGIGRGIQALLSWTFARAARLRGVAGHRRIAAVVSAPGRFAATLPAGWIGAFLALLWIALVGRTMGPLGLLAPPGVLSSFVYGAGIVGAFLGAAWRVDHPSDREPGQRPGGFRQASAAALVVLAGTALIGGAAFAVWPGTTDGLVTYDPAFDGRLGASVGAGPSVSGTTAQPLVDPGEPGPYAIERLTYGSGTDGRRPAFGAEADIVTPTVDASAILPPLEGGADAVRATWWGFGTDALPLDGLVWSPVGDGPFPLVLIVHGNHAMGDFSEPGYAYLAEHLASRGFIAVSIDEDFLNGSWAGEWDGAEQLARAWLLLLHADLWRTWNADEASPFHDRVDLERLTLIGHSRGGEASAVAAMLASRSAAPNSAMLPWPTGLAVHSVVSIAPSDGQFMDGLRLQDVDFLAIAGGHDADARAWSGIRQYARATVGPGGFKAALWAYRANHGQFNRVWGSGDFGPFSGAQLNLAALLTQDEQEDVARTAIGAFLEASLRGQTAYRGFFERPMTGRDWLPQDIYLVRSSDGDLTPLTRGASTPIDGTAIEHDGFASVRTITIPLRALQPDQATGAVNARWEAGEGDAVWGMTGLDTVIATLPTDTLRFAVADGSEIGPDATRGLDVTVEALDLDGTVVALPLAEVGALPPPLPARLAKDPLVMATTSIDISLRSPVERVLQTYAIPLAMFEEAGPAFDASHLAGFRLRFDRERAGVAWIADVAIGH